MAANKLKLFGKISAKMMKMIDEAYRECLAESSTSCEWFTKFKKGEFDLEVKPIHQ